HPEAGGRERRLRRSATKPPEGEAAAVVAAAALAHRAEIALATQALHGAETHGARPRGRAAFRRPSGACSPCDGGRQAPCGRPGWTCRRETRFCARAFCDVDRRSVA